MGVTSQTICYHVYDGSYCKLGGVMNFLQDKRVLWGGAVIIVLVVLVVLYA